MSCKRVVRWALLFIVAFAPPTTLVVAPAQAAPGGKLLVTTYQNDATSPKCGRYTVEMFNSSSRVIVEAKILVNVVTDFDTGKESPFRGSPKRSWVVFKTLLKPGDFRYETMNLCSTVNLTGDERDFTSFTVGKVRWKWA